MKRNKKMVVSIASFLKGKKIRDISRETRQLQISTKKRITDSENKWNKW
jgi:hypothetical protein